MTVSAHSLVSSLVFCSFLTVGCHDAPAPTETAQAAPEASNASMQGTASGIHGTALLEPTTPTVYVDPSQISTYVIPIEAEFWFEGGYTFSGWAWWHRDVRWRSCGSSAPGTALYAAQGLILSGQTYNERYTEPMSFTPGAYGPYEIVSKSWVRWCPPGVPCGTMGDDVQVTACVTLTTPQPLGLELDGPAWIQTKGEYTYTATTTNFLDPTFTWRERFCDDNQGGPCTPWATYTGIEDIFTPNLDPDCGLPERNYQVEVTALDSDGRSLIRGMMTWLCMQ